jgi:hypothetical protein
MDLMCEWTAAVEGRDDEEQSECMFIRTYLKRSKSR